MEKKQTNKKFIIIIGILLLTGITYGTYKYVHSLSHEEQMMQVEKHESYYSK
jgi:membrane fusion protein (multidrug efflux system)